MCEMYLIFENNGEIDKRAITVMGASVKSDSAIGYFGTGLKFSISTLLRNCHFIQITSGKDVLNFTSQSQKIRGSDFDIVCMNDIELSFTTNLGRDWKVWQAFRELYSNCLDEGGTIYMSEIIPEARSDKTIVAVSGDEIIECFKNKNDIFIDENDVINEKSKSCESYKGHGIFYRGVRVLENINTFYRYNVLNKIDLTEDRTAKYLFQIKEAISSHVTKSDNKIYITAVLTEKQRTTLEGECSFDSVCDRPSNAFMEVCKDLIKNRRMDIRDDAVKLFEKYSEKIKPDPVILNHIEKMQLDKALHLCDKLGFPARGYPISTYETLGHGVLALAHTHEKGKEIYLSKEIYSKGVMCLTRGLIEEYIHLHYGYDDYTCEMQNFIFDKMTAFGMQSIGEVA